MSLRTVPLNTPAAWHGRDLRSRQAWTVQLEAEQVTQLQQETESTGFARVAAESSPASTAAMQVRVGDAC